METDINSAINKGYFQQVRFLIAFGCDVNERDNDHRTPLINCSFIEEEAWGVGIARTLLENGATVGSCDRRGLNALHYATIYRRTGLVDVCLAAIDCSLNRVDRYGNTALHYAVLSSDDDSIARLLVNTALKYHVSVDTRNRQGVTPLIQACKVGNTKCARLLREVGNANEEARDLISMRTATEWEQYCNKHACSERQSKYGIRDANHVAAKRVGSAPPFLLRRDKFNKEKKLIDSDDMPTAKLLGKSIRIAPDKDLRNKPEYIIDVSSVDCFASRPSFTRRRSTIHDLRRHTCDSTTPASWRTEMRALYKVYDFQFTSSYLRGATRPMPSVLHDDDADSHSRPASAVAQSETNSEVVTLTSERAGTASRRLMRKHSVLIRAESRLRRNSALDSRSRKQSTSTLQGNETTIEVTASAKKPPADNIDESSDTSMDGGKKKITSAQPRTASAQPRTASAQPSRGTLDRTSSPHENNSIQRDGSISPPTRPASRTGYYGNESPTSMATSDYLDAIRETPGTS